jgi:hypothetical protein
MLRWTRPIPQFVLCEQPVIQVASVFTATLFVELVRATSDVASYGSGS